MRGRLFRRWLDLLIFNRYNGTASSAQRTWECSECSPRQKVSVYSRCCIDITDSTAFAPANATTSSVIARRGEPAACGWRHDVTSPRFRGASAVFKDAQTLGHRNVKKSRRIKEEGQRAPYRISHTSHTLCSHHDDTASPHPDVCFQREGPFVFWWPTDGTHSMCSIRSLSRENRPSVPLYFTCCLSYAICVILDTSMKSYIADTYGLVSDCRKLPTAVCRQLRDTVVSRTKSTRETRTAHLIV